MKGKKGKGDRTAAVKVAGLIYSGVEVYGIGNLQRIGPTREPRDPFCRQDHIRR